MVNKNQLFRELAPLYVKGELTAEQRMAFEQQLEQDDELKHEVEEYSVIKDSYSGLLSTLPEPSPDIFLKVMNKIRVEERLEEVLPSTRKDPSKISVIMDGFRRFFSMPGPAWTLAAVQAVALLIIVFSGQSETGFKTLSGGDEAAQNDIKLNVVFNETAQQGDINRLLMELGATLVDGPAETGLYVVLVHDETKKDEALNILGKAPEVKFVQLRY